MAISKETLGLIAAFKDPLISAFKDAKNEVEYFFDNGLANYIDVQRDKFLYTKTFLFRNERVKFYDTFYSVKLADKKVKIDIRDNPLNIFENKRCVSIIGYAGSGKSMLLKHIFLNTLEHYKLIPIVIELRYPNDYNGTLTEYIYDKVLNNKLSPNSNILERILNEGNFLFLLDGYDEIYSKSKGKITNDIDEFIDRYNKNLFLITSRPGANVESMPRFDNLFVQSLESEEIKEFIKIQLAQTDHPELAEKIIEAINREGYESFEHYLGIPLLLSMFILTYENHPTLPKSKNRFYWNVFDTLTSRHDSITKKGGYQHERKTKLQSEEIEQILKWFSYHSLFEGKFSFDRQYLSEKLQVIKGKLGFDCETDDLIEDLTVSLAIIIIEGLDYKFPHRSMQEYFTALLIKDLPQDVKPKIYEEKVSQRRSWGVGENNFWDLCYELDKKDFMQFYLLKRPKEFCNDVLSAETDIEAIVRYGDWKGLFQTIIIEKDTEKIREITEWQYGNNINEILNFLDNSWIYNAFLSQSLVMDKFSELRSKSCLEDTDINNDVFGQTIKDEGLENFLSYRLLYDNEQFAEIAASYEFAKEVRTKVERLKTLLEQKEAEIKQETANTLSLL